MGQFKAIILLTVIGLAILFSGCTGKQGGTPTPSPTVTAAATITATSTVTAAATITAAATVTAAPTVTATPVITVKPKPLAIASQTVSPGGAVTVPIIASGFTNVAAFTISLTYNPAVVVVDSVGAGALGGVFANINNAAGVTQMSAFSTTPQSGNVIFANVTLKAVGTAGQTSPLNLTVTTLVDDNGIPISASVNSGVFTISAV